MHRPDTAIMVTGGIDSTTLLYTNQDLHPTLITVDYGHVAFPKQLEMINQHVKILGLADPVVLKIDYKDWQSSPGLFTPGYAPEEEAPLEDWNKLRYNDFFIEGRNMIMVAYVLAYCSAHKIDELLAGYLYGEEEWRNRRSYKLMTGDNSPQFVDSMNLLSGLGLSHQVRFRAPFYEQRLSKKDVIELGRKWGIDFSLTYSCYFDKPCGKCDNCLLRKKYL